MIMNLKEANKNIWELVEISRSKEELVRILVASFSDPRSFDTYGISSYSKIESWQIVGGGDPPKDYDPKSIMARQMLSLAIQYIISDISIDSKTTQDTIRRTIILFEMLLDKATEMAVYWTLESGDLKNLKEDFNSDTEKYFKGFSRVEFDGVDDFIYNDPVLPSEDFTIYREVNLKDIQHRCFHAEAHRDLSKELIQEFETGMKQLQTLLTHYVDGGIGSKYSKQLKWNGTDNDLLEMVVALWEMKAIQNDQLTLTKKDAIEAFSEFLQHDISYAESKVSKLILRKKGNHPFLDSMIHAFDGYADRQLGK